MWIMTARSGFISVVKDRDSDHLWARARVEQDLREYFPRAKIQTKPGADYLYRAKVTRKALIRVMTQLVNDLDYTGHVKEEVADHAPIPKAGNRYNGMLACWAAMAEWQPIPPYSTNPRSILAAESDWGDYEKGSAP